MRQLCKVPAVATLVGALACGPPPLVPPPGPLAVSTVATPSPGHQGYVGAAGPFPTTLDLGWRWQAPSGTTLDVQGTHAFVDFVDFGGGGAAWSALSPGISHAVPLDARRRHLLAPRLGVIGAIGDREADTRLSMISAGASLRLQYVAQVGRGGLLHVSLLGAYTHVLRHPPLRTECSDDGDTCDRQVVLPDALAWNVAFGGDVPVGPVALVMGIGGGFAQALGGGRYPALHTSLGLRFGSRSTRQHGRSVGGDASASPLVAPGL